MTVNYTLLHFVVFLQFTKCILLCSSTTKPAVNTQACNERLILQQQSDSTFLLQSSSFCCFVQV